LSLAKGGGPPPVSRGAAFLVDAKKGLFLTARHVLVGDRSWSTDLPAPNRFLDLDSAIENHLRSTNVKVTLSPGSFGTAVEARVVALDRNSDLALLQAKSIGQIPTANFPGIFTEVPFADRFDCEGDVSAIGYSDATNPGEYRLDSTKFAPAVCDFAPKAYYVGDILYNFSLYSTSAPFQPGFSGGPVLNQYWEVIGVVSGASVTQAGQSNFFVPSNQVKAFLTRFR
jgi:S1-C subfamily serine protease